MDVETLAIFTTLNLLGKRYMKEFVNSQKTYVSEDVLFNLLRVKYLIDSKGSCWTKDLIDGISEKREGTEKRVNIGMYYMKQGRLVTQHEKDKVLGHRWELTNKGIFIMQQYTAFLREKQRKYHYKIKQSHKESRELKEKK